MNNDKIQTDSGEVISTYGSIPFDQLRKIYELVRDLRLKEAEAIIRKYPEYSDLQVKQLMGYIYEVISNRIGSEKSALASAWWKATAKKI